MLVPRLVLASGSPRRRELLAVAGYEFVVDVADIDETIGVGESPVAATTRLAIEKAEAVVRRRAGGCVVASSPSDGGSALIAGQSEQRTVGPAPDAGESAPGDREYVLAADTTVVVGERILGKPSDTREAADMLLSLAGRNHIVLTAWALLGPHGRPVAPECGVSRSIVRMREISRAEAEAYASTGEPMDKAGGYAAQGEGRRFIGAIVGPLDNVIGLPMAPVTAALARSGIVPA
ncbi:MAG: nucleoside triphosphate pyrophosphatase [Candidatus Binatia bacterium]